MTWMPDLRGRLACLLLAVLGLLSAGCVAEAPPSTEEADAAAQEHALTKTFSGFYIYRTPLGVSQATQFGHTGDPPAFCFLVPSGTRSIEAVFSWEQQLDEMYLQFAPPGSGSVTESTNGSTPPLRLAVDSPTPGEWFLYAGPGTVGGATDFEIRLTWTADRPVEETEVEYAGEPCY